MINHTINFLPGSFIKISFFFVLHVCFFIQVNAQTGPAGVGTLSGNVGLWLDASTLGLANGAVVNPWTDNSGYGYNATGVNSPTYSVGVLNAAGPSPGATVSFKQTSAQYFRIADHPEHKGVTVAVFVVGMLTNLSGTWAPFIIKDADYTWLDGWGVSRNNGTSQVWDYVTNWNACGTGYSVSNVAYGYGTHGTTTNFGIMTENYDKVNVQFYINSTSAGTCARAVNIAYTGAHDLDIGVSPRAGGNSNVQAGSELDGEIAEIITYSTSVNTGQRIIVENYLSSKYNLALASNDKYAGDTPGNGNYDLHVAGIGQASAGNTNTAFATSACAGLGMTYVSGFADGDYILAGHNLTYNFEDQVDVGGMTGASNARWVRDWFVDVTNTGANMVVNLSFDLSDGGVGAAASMTAANYELLYRAGTSGNWTESLAGTATVAGDVITFSGVTLTTDGYYTVGSKDFNTSSLPIELLNFSATPNKNKVDLKWTTSTETNNKYFTVERSSEDQKFTALTTINTKAANGNSNLKLDYVTTDESPLSGTSYYRLKQTDFNGKYKYFNIVSVDYVKDKNITFIVYPNPNQGEFSVDFTGVENNHEVQILLYDEQGRQVYSNSFYAQESVNSLKIIPTEKIGRGIYFCSLVVEGIKYTVKTIVE